MEYEGQICRAPMERASFMLPVVVGCAYNRCKFCDLFKHLKYRELPLEQIEEELKRVRDIGGNPRRVFLGDGSAFTLSVEKLLAVLDLIHQYFPGCESVNMDATVSSILNKTPKELKTLYENGVRHLYIGIESGLDDVLRFMDKDHGLLEAYEAASQLNRAGLIFDAHIMTGVAGKGRGIENAKALAEFFNRAKACCEFFDVSSPETRFIPGDSGGQFCSGRRTGESERRTVPDRTPGGPRWNHLRRLPRFSGIPGAGTSSGGPGKDAWKT